MSDKDCNNAKERIIRASIQLFSLNGFDATSVKEIAKSAGVTKALIYYYFKNKEDILDSLVSTLLEDFTSIAVDFIHEHIIQMVQDGVLIIEADRLKFSEEKDITYFLYSVQNYWEKILDYTLENRSIIRILMLESLKNSKYHNELFRLINLTEEPKEHLISKTISKTDTAPCYSNDMLLFKFFFSIFPLVNFAAYYDYYKTLTKQDDTELKQSFLRSCSIISSSMVSGRDILLHITNNEK